MEVPALQRSPPNPSDPPSPLEDHLTNGVRGVTIDNGISSKIDEEPAKLKGSGEGEERELPFRLAATKVKVCASEIWIRIRQLEVHAIGAKGPLDDPKMTPEGEPNEPKEVPDVPPSPLEDYLTYLEHGEGLKVFNRKCDEIDEALAKLRGAQGREEGQVRELHSHLFARELLHCAGRIWIRILESKGDLTPGQGVLDDPEIKDQFQKAATAAGISDEEAAAICKRCMDDVNNACLDGLDGKVVTVGHAMKQFPDLEDIHPLEWKVVSEYWKLREFLRVIY